MSENLEMSENLKYRREMVFKVLAWGTVVLLLVWGYSLTQSNLFELKPPPKEETDLKDAKRAQAHQLEKDAVAAMNANNSKDANELKVRAAQIKLDVHLDEEVRNDRWWRAVGLIFGALVYCISYPIVVRLVYKRAYPDVVATEQDVFPLKHALFYAIVVSVSTFITACLTAWR